MKSRLVSVLLFIAILLPALQASAKVDLKEEGFYVDGKYFFPIGVNYMPRDSAIWMWKKYDPEQIRREFGVLKDAGINTVRVFIFWEDLNPEPGVIDEKNIEQIGEVLDIAHQQGLMAVPTHFTGHMSGGNWAPGWMIKGRFEDMEGTFRKEPFRPPTLHLPRTYRDIYEDELARENSLLMCRVLAKKFKDHPAILYWDFGNEPQYWMRPSDPETGQDYVDAVVSEIKKYDPNHPVGLGMGKFAEDSGFHSYGEYGMNRVEDLYIVHTYPSGYYPYSAKVVDRYSTWFAGFENSLSRVSGIPVQFQEFGLSDQMLVAMGKKERQERLHGYYNCSVWGSQMGGARAGVLAWMSGDYKRTIFFREPYLSRPYELDFGIYDTDYRLKGSGQAFSKFAEVTDEIYQTPQAPHFDPVAIVLPENYQDMPGGKDKNKGKFGDTHKNHNRFLFSAWLIMRQLGINPEFKAPFQDWDEADLVIVPALSSPSDDFSKSLMDYAKKGGTLYMPGYHSLNGDYVIPGVELAEIANAMDPSDEMFERLRKKYAFVLKTAGVAPVVTSSEPFVEVGLLGDKYLVLTNHLPEEVETVVRTSRGSDVKNCFYGQTPDVTEEGSFIFGLPGFGAEVCELKVP